MNLKFYLDKGRDKIKFDLIFAFNRFKKNSIFKINLNTAKFPIFLRENSSDSDTFYQIFYYKGYNVDFNFEPKVIVDCGANIGLASVYFKNKYPQAKIISVEPASSNFEMLVKNTEKYDDIHCLQAGIWNKNAILKVVDNGYGEWGFMTEEVDTEGPDTIKSVSIDGLMEKYNLDHIDILKIDIEGSEKELFEKNYEKWLPKVKVILIELHDGMKEGCIRTFFKAMVNYKFTMRYKGENIICEML